MNQTLVSISCITYNHAPYIKECLDGFLMQKTNFAFEIIIHDDASSDGTKEIIEEYVSKYPDIIFPLIQIENQYSKGIRGMMPRFNFPRCQGKYIALCEGDDYWTDPYKLQKQVDFLEANEEYSLYLGNLQRIEEHEQDGGFKTLKVISNTSFSLTSRDLLKHPFHGVTASAMFRKSALRSPEFMQKVKVGEIALWMIVAKHGLVYFSNEVFGVYRRHLGSISISESFKSDSPELLKSYVWFYFGLLKYYEGNLYRELSDKTLFFFNKLSQAEFETKNQLKHFLYIKLFRQFPGILKVYLNFYIINKFYATNKIQIDNREITFLSENLIVVPTNIINSFIEVEVQDKFGVENLGEFVIGRQGKIFLTSDKFNKSNSFSVNIRNLHDNNVKVLNYK
jgi:glycosyltransferase involved in cell wall biosynthesis